MSRPMDHAGEEDERQPDLSRPDYSLVLSTPLASSSCLGRVSLRRVAAPTRKLIMHGLDAWWGAVRRRLKDEQEAAGVSAG